MFFVFNFASNVLNFETKPLWYLTVYVLVATTAVAVVVNENSIIFDSVQILKLCTKFELHQKRTKNKKKVEMFYTTRSQLLFECHFNCWEKRARFQHEFAASYIIFRIGMCSKTLDRFKFWVRCAFWASTVFPKSHEEIWKRHSNAVPRFWRKLREKKRPGFEIKVIPKSGEYVNSHIYSVHFFGGGGE